VRSSRDVDAIPVDGLGDQADSHEPAEDDVAYAESACYFPLVLFGLLLSVEARFDAAEGAASDGGVAGSSSTNSISTAAVGAADDSNTLIAARGSANRS
jgi:hypothetical protein